jgi:mono/diheme cytochrome c family protein
MKKTSRLRKAGSWIVAFGCLVLITGLVVFPTTNVEISEPDDRGRSAFIEKGCANCHAVYGQKVDGSVPKGGPDLGEKKIYGTHLELASMVWNHLPRMLRKMEKQGYDPPIFTPDEVEQIISYLSFIRYIGQPGNVRTGRKLLQRRGCRKCHSFDGVGGDVGPDFTDDESYVSPLALAASMWNHGPDMIDLFDQHGVKRTRFRADEMVNLAAAIRSYISTTRIPPGSFDPGDPDSGERLISDTGCTRCHSVGGEGGSDAPDFYEMDFDKSVTAIAGDFWSHGPKMWESMKDLGIVVPTFDRDRMADVIAYLYSLRLHDAPGDETSGANLLDSKGCTTCHPVNGVGGQGSHTDFAAVEDLDSPLSMLAKMWSHAPEISSELRETRTKWPELSSREMADIYAYLRSVSE